MYVGSSCSIAQSLGSLRIPEALSVFTRFDSITQAIVGQLALTLGGSSLLYLLIQRGAATQVTSLLYLVPPCTALMAWLIFGESLTAAMMLGMALTAAGVALVVRHPGR